MKYSENSADLLLGQWRQSAATSSYETVLSYARQFSVSGNTEEIETAQAENGLDDMDSVIDGLYCQARASSPESADDHLIKHNIIADAMNLYPLLSDKSASHSGPSSPLNQILESFPNVAKWCTGIYRPTYAIATLVLFVAGASAYLNVLHQQALHQESIAYMDIPGEYNYEMALSDGMMTLGFSRDNSPQKYEFDLGRTLSKISHLDEVLDDEGLQRLLELHVSALTSGDNRLLREIAENLANNSGQIREIIAPYLAEPVIYAGYWVQNAIFVSWAESVRDFDMLINHVDLLPTLKKLLSAEQFTKASELIQGYRREPATVSSMEIQMFSKMLWIWLG